MKKILVFATGNANKVREVRQLLGDQYEIKSLVDIGCTEDIPETEDTFEGNALLKARYVKENYNLDCFSEDTGLEVDALNGEPGVYSARYAGPDRQSGDNIRLVLSKLEGQHNRSARFRTALALIIDGEEHIFEGIVEGRIREELSGTGGFGYDPVFEPQGYDITFAEMSPEDKNKISHRGRAVSRLLDFLKQKNS